MKRKRGCLEGRVDLEEQEKGEMIGRQEGGNRR